MYHKKIFFYFVFSSLYFIIFCGLVAQTSQPHTITALKIETAPRLDGNLQENYWQKTKKISNFTQRELEEGESATERTEVAALFTSRSLYLGFWCYDTSPERIVAKEMKRDFRSRGEDNIEIVIDTYHDRRNSYHFVINPNGARFDELITDEGKGRNADWNGVWDVRTIITEEGWFVEIEIPFSTLKFSDAKQQIWGINFQRNLSRKNEQVLWQGWSRNYYLEQVSHAGILNGLNNNWGQAFKTFKT